MRLEILKKEHIDIILPIVSAVNDQLNIQTITDRLTEMFAYPNYYCFGLFDEDELIALTSGWALTKIYSGRQLELDNFAVAAHRRNDGSGKILHTKVQHWAQENGFVSLELNCYVSNGRAHKFYFSQDYSIIGYPFQKDLG